MLVNYQHLVQVLSKAHRGHRYVVDAKQYQQVEFWEKGLVGDCEDFALWCRAELAVLGIESDLVYCLTEDGEGHLVCAVGGWILDNRYLSVQVAAEMSYTWLRIGKPDGQWFAVAGFETTTDGGTPNAG